MAIRHIRLVLGLFFLIAGLVLLALRYFAPDAVAKQFDLTRLTIGAFLALVFGGVNLAKWYAGWMAFQHAATPLRRPFQSDAEETGASEPNPEFDFTKPTNEK